MNIVCARSVVVTGSGLYGVGNDCSTRLLHRFTLLLLIGHCRLIEARRLSPSRQDIKVSGWVS